MITNRPIFIASEETKQVQAALAKLAIGECITWNELCSVAKGNIKKARGCLSTARVALVKDGMVYASVRGIGYKRLDDSEIVQNEGMTTGRIKRTVKRSLQRLTTVKPDNLTPIQRTDYSVTSATLGALALCSDNKFRSSVTQTVISNGSTDAASSLRLFCKE
jgi:hypothetical protein